jgi:para-aminobenzoate synthetase component 1
VTTIANEAQLPLVEQLDSPVEPEEVFRRLSGLPHVVFFDSAMRHTKLGRYSFVAADPIKWLEVPADGRDAFGILNAELAALSGEILPGLPPFQGGWAGLFGYELSASLEKVPRAAIDEFGVPALAVGLYDVVAAFDHYEKRAWLISQGWPAADATARRERAKDRIAAFRSRLRSCSPNSNQPGPQRTLPQGELAAQYSIAEYPGLTSNFSAEQYRATVGKAIDYIYAGDVFQVNLSQRLLHPASTDAVELYCRLRERNPAPFAGFLNGGDWQIASASPERFIQVSDGRVETRPIKGTRGRARRPEADLFAGDDLQASEKDRAENIMIVDLLRNDLSRTCLPESVRVSQLCGLEMYEYVQHLVSVVEGTLQPNCTPLDVLRTSFPGGSITGAPKIRAMEIIAELEPTVRGAYCGSLGYIGVGGRMDMNILIRTITSSRGWWQVPVGGGIVAQSNPQSEYEETWHKAAGMLRALQG